MLQTIIAKAKSAVAVAKQVWVKVPHKWQAAILGIGSAFLVGFGHALAKGNCYTLGCFKVAVLIGITDAKSALAAVIGALLAGGTTVAAFYMTPNRTK